MHSSGYRMALIVAVAVVCGETAAVVAVVLPSRASRTAPVVRVISDQTRSLLPLTIAPAVQRTHTSTPPPQTSDPTSRPASNDPPGTGRTPSQNWADYTSLPGPAQKAVGQHAQPPQPEEPRAPRYP